MDYANDQVKALFEKIENGCNKAVEFMNSEFGVMRVGRANPKLLDRITVEYYGTTTPLMQMANISSPEARTLIISVWDKSALKDVEKAILAANIGVTPQNDGTIIRLTFPEVTEERRKDLVKQIKKLGEDTKVVVRNERRDAMDKLKKIKNEKTLSEDLIADYEVEVDKEINKYIENIEKLVKDKEKEVMNV